MFVEEDELERDKQLLELRARVQEAEEERLKGKPTMSISEARKAFDKRRDQIILSCIQEKEKNNQNNCHNHKNII